MICEIIRTLNFVATDFFVPVKTLVSVREGHKTCEESRFSCTERVHVFTDSSVAEIERCSNDQRTIIILSDSSSASPPTLTSSSLSGSDGYESEYASSTFSYLSDYSGEFNVSKLKVKRTMSCTVTRGLL